MDLTTDISTGTRASRFGRDQTFSSVACTTRWQSGWIASEPSEAAS
jgi:hypothetical protein